MSGSTESLTTTTLLEGLRHSKDQAVWQEFDSRYRPIILGMAARLGLPREDAADVAQETLASFVRAYQAGRYRREQGRLRSWIIGILKHRVADWRRSDAARRHLRGDSALADVADSDALDALWESQRRTALVSQALVELRQKTRLSEKSLQAFEAYVVRQQPVEEVSKQFGMTAHDVYMVKNRVAERLREMLTRLEAIFDDR